MNFNILYVSSGITLLSSLALTILNFDKTKPRAYILLFITVIASIFTFGFSIRNINDQTRASELFKNNDTLWRDSIRKNNDRQFHLEDSIHSLTKELKDSYKKLFYTTIRIANSEIESRRKLGGGNNFPIITFQDIRLNNDSVLLSFQCANSSESYPLKTVKISGLDVNFAKEHFNIDKYPTPGSFEKEIGDMRGGGGEALYEKVINKDLKQFEISFRVAWSSGFHDLNLMIERVPDTSLFNITKATSGNAEAPKTYYYEQK